MGSYTDLSINGYSVHSYKSRVDPVVMTIFREADKIYRLVSYSDRGDTIVLSTGNQVPLARPDEDEHVEVAYVSVVGAVRQRLDVMGFTLAESVRAFEEGIADDVDELRQYENDDNAGIDFWSEELRILRSLSFAKWRDAFGDLKRRDVHSYNLDAEFMNGQPADVTELQRYMLRADREHWFGFPNVDFRFFLRAALETCDPAGVVEQDLSALVGGGYYSIDSRVAEESRQLLLADVPANAPILVLTEGSSDVYAIEAALAGARSTSSRLLLFPELRIDERPGWRFDVSWLREGVCRCRSCQSRRGFIRQRYRSALRSAGAKGDCVTCERARPYLSAHRYRE